MSPPLLVAVFAGLTVVASLVGGWIPLVARMSHARTQMMMSLVAGLMLGVGVFHMLPHAYAQLRSLDQAVWWLMVGLLGTFFLQRFFHFHQHEAPEALLADGARAASAPGYRGDEGHHADHGHSHGTRDHSRQQTGHEHDKYDRSGHEHCGHEHAGQGTASFSWLGLAVGLIIHTTMDGVALAAAVESESQLHDSARLAGLGVFLAVFLHKPLDAMAIAALMMRDGWSPRARHVVNVLFSLICPLGAALFYLSLHQFQAAQQMAVGCALAMSAGVFLCISLGDLLPELQFHSHDRFKLSLALLLGVALAYGIGFLEESGHDHDAAHDERHEHHGHDH